MSGLIHYCTYFDSRYLSRGLALHESLLRHSPPFRLFILCMDEPVRATLQKMNLAGVELVSLTELETADRGLLDVKLSRSLIEYYFTCSPCWPLYLMDRLAEGECLHYLDADLYFFSSPEPIFQEMGDGSVLIIEHRFPRALKHLELYGIFNVGWVSFRKSAAGLQCLRWWRERCLEWCRDFPEDGKFADQKYLDQWPFRFEGVVVLQHKGAGIAPWNISEQQLTVSDGVLRCESGVPLIFYHFHKFKALSDWLFELALDYTPHPKNAARRLIYRPYIVELKRQAARVRSIQPDFDLAALPVRKSKRRTAAGMLRLFLSGELMVVFQK